MESYIIKAAAKSFQGGSGSPLEARQTAPIFLIIMLLVIFILILSVAFFIYKAISSYFKSEKYFLCKSTLSQLYIIIVLWYALSCATIGT